MTTGKNSLVERAVGYARKRQSPLSLLFAIFCACSGLRLLRSRAIRLICKLEGGQMWSQSFRNLLMKHYRVEVGIHSYGTCLWPGHLPAETRVGNYCSLADGLYALRRNHSVDRISQHPFFYNAMLGLVEPGLVHELADNPLTIGHDVWIGLNVIITPSCRTIGNSAIVAAGSVVTTDVPPFAIVGGVPAKLIRWRFPEPIREALTRSQWWLKPVWELTEYFNLFMEPASTETVAALENALHKLAPKGGSRAK